MTCFTAVVFVTLKLTFEELHGINKDLGRTSRLLLRLWSRRMGKIVVPFPARGFSILERVQTDTGPHTTFSVRTGCSFPAGKLRVTTLSWPFTYVYSQNWPSGPGNGHL